MTSEDETPFHDGDENETPFHLTSTKRVAAFRRRRRGDKPTTVGIQDDD
jgi:hypothetical protein